jgi:hypothetical protein
MTSDARQAQQRISVEGMTVPDDGRRKEERIRLVDIAVADIAVVSRREADRLSAHARPDAGWR